MDSYSGEDDMSIHIGSVVTHPLFRGPGTVVAFHDNNGKNIVEVFWQSMNRIGFHSFANIRPITRKSDGR